MGAAYDFADSIFDFEVLDLPSEEGTEFGSQESRDVGVVAIPWRRM